MHANFYSNPDPFFVKEEFAPSDRAGSQKRQQLAHNLVTPHMRLLHFLGSHYNATRLCNPHTEMAFLRLLEITFDGYKHATDHPLAREVRFEIVLFGLKVMKHSTGLDFMAKCRLKNKILSAALTWFSFAPMWTFGGNRLQLKAEIALLSDVSAALRSVPLTSSDRTPLLNLIHEKETLLNVLLETERSKLLVWLNPLTESSDGAAPGHLSKSAVEVSFSNCRPLLL